MPNFPLQSRRPEEVERLNALQREDHRAAQALALLLESSMFAVIVAAACIGILVWLNVAHPRPETASTMRYYDEGGN